MLIYVDGIFSTILGGPWQILGRLFVSDYEMFVALLADTRTECKKRCQESLEIIKDEA